MADSEVSMSPLSNEPDYTSSESREDGFREFASGSGKEQKMEKIGEHEDL